MNEGMENLKEIEELEEDKRTLFKIVDKLEKRIFLLEKVIGKLQLKVADIVYWIDNKLERKQ
jgi:argininosuccinate lyase